AVGQRAKEDRAHDAEDRGRGADAEGERQGCEGQEGGGAEQLAGGNEQTFHVWPRSNRHATPGIPVTRVCSRLTDRSWDGAVPGSNRPSAIHFVGLRTVIGDTSLR